MESSKIPQSALIKMAIELLKSKIGTIKVRAKINLAKKVLKVADQICFSEYLASDSTETWMPKASEKASAMAMEIMPPITTIFEPVLAFKPIIIPRVVITPEVKPKLKPLRMAFFIN